MILKLSFNDEGRLSWMALVPLTPPRLFQVKQGEQSWGSETPGTQNTAQGLSGIGIVLDLPSGRSSPPAIPTLFLSFPSGFSCCTSGMLQMCFPGSLIALAQYSMELAMLLGV